VLGDSSSIFSSEILPVPKVVDHDRLVGFATPMA
jgi:hypothetical protein